MIPSRLAQRNLLTGMSCQYSALGFATEIKVFRPTLVRTSPSILNHCYRPLTTESIPDNEAGSIIAAQRKNRPISPHLGIYKPQVTWYLSGFNRIAGAVLSGGRQPSSFLHHVKRFFGFCLLTFSCVWLVRCICFWGCVCCGAIVWMAP